MNSPITGDGGGGGGCATSCRILWLQIRHSSIGLIRVRLKREAGENLQNVRHCSIITHSNWASFSSVSPFLFLVVILLGPVHGADAVN